MRVSKHHPSFSPVPGESQFRADVFLLYTLNASKSLSSSDNIGKQIYSGRGWQMSNAQVKIRRPGPGLGEHNEQVLSDLLGYDSDTIDDFYDLGIIADEPINQRSSANPPSLEKLKEDGTITDFDTDYKINLGLG